MIHISEKRDCCGCSACVQRCPEQCITLREDAEGFLYPEVDKGRCIDCGLCEKVCPVLNQEEERQPLILLAAKNKDQDIRMDSSSGGVFSLLAECIIDENGAVFGARFNDDWSVVHDFTKVKKDLSVFRGSKYVQSYIGDSFLQIEKMLKAGQKVMFTGTSCQVRGLKLFLRKDYPNLLTVDFICHGVPSPKVWKKYLNEILDDSARRAVAGKNTVLSSSLNDMPVITGIAFRDKKLYGWKKYSFVVRGKSASKADKNSVLLSDMVSSNAYMRVFLNNYCLRPSCYSCPAKGGKANSDITLADFWGIETFYPEFDDDKGVSLVVTNTLKGNRILQKIENQMDFINVVASTAFAHNGGYFKSVAIPAKRDDFWRMFEEGFPIHQIVHRLLPVTFRQQVRGVLKKLLKRI